MIILLSCLGSFATGVAVGMLIVSYRWGKAIMQMEEIIEKNKKMHLTNATKYDIIDNVNIIHELVIEIAMRKEAELN